MATHNIYLDHDSESIWNQYFNLDNHSGKRLNFSSWIQDNLKDMKPNADKIEELNKYNENLKLQIRRLEIDLLESQKKVESIREKELILERNKDKLSKFSEANLEVLKNKEKEPSIFELKEYGKLWGVGVSDIIHVWKVLHNV